MSVSASIDLKVIGRNGFSPTASYIIESLLANGWSIYFEDKVSYLPINDNDMFDWQHKSIDQTTLMNIIKRKESLYEKVGLLIVYGETGIGGDLLIDSYIDIDDDLSICNSNNIDITFCLGVNRLKLKNIKEKDITDVGWYFERIIPYLETEKTFLVSITFAQY